MKQVTTNEFKGLRIQPNSLTVPAGSLEIAENALVSQDYTITKPRGLHLFHKFTQDIRGEFEYNSRIFAATTANLWRLEPSLLSAQAKSVSGTQIINVRTVAAHGLTNNDYITEFDVDNDDPFCNVYPLRHVAFYGLNQITNAYTGLAATRTSNVVTITLANHGLVTGDTITVGTNTLVITQTTFSITVTGTNTFTIASTGSNGSGTVNIVTLNAFRLTADEDATASVSSGVAAATFRYHIVMTGVSVIEGPTAITRFVTSNRNGYFTSDNGILKLESTTAPILKAGMPPGLDIQGDLSGVTGPVLPNSQVAYRVVFGRKDVNKNLVLGAPSESLSLTNIAIAVSDSSLAYNTGTHVVTVTSVAHGLTTGDTVYLNDFVATCSTGTYVIANGSAAEIIVTGVDTFTFDIGTIQQENLTNVTDVVALDYGVAKVANLTFTIPSELTSTEYLYQIYRTTGSSNDTTPAEPNYRLVEEANLTASQISAGFVQYTDETDDALIKGNAQLYTNPSEEGELQANARPPLASGIALFKNYVFYSGVTDYSSLLFNLVAPADIVDGSTVTIGTQVFVFVGNSTNQKVGNQSTTDPATTTSYVEITHNNHGFNSSDTVYVTSFGAITGISPGLFTIISATANTFRIGSGASGSGNVTYEGVANATGQRFVKRVISVSGSTTIAEAIDDTARLFIKAINRDAASQVYAQYISSLDSAPGKMYLVAKDVSTNTVTLVTNTTATGQSFFPVIPTTGTSLQVSRQSQPNSLRVGKNGEPEAVPVENDFPVGSASYAMLDIRALRDSLIIIKEDGVFRLNGDNLGNFNTTTLDSTVLCVAKKSIVILNNSVYMLSNQGMVQITDTNVRIITRNIELPISSILGNPNLSAATSGVAYESERLYLVATLKPNTNDTVMPNVVWCYNYLTDEWTTWNRDIVFFQSGMIDSSDKAILAIEDDMLYLERKHQTKVDWSDQEFAVNAIVASIVSATASSGSTSIEVETDFEHALLVGDKITVSRTDSALAAAFSGGDSDVNGVRVVTSIVSETEFTFDADTSANLNAVGDLFYNTGVNELDISGTTLNGSVQVTFTFPNHGFVTGQSIRINYLSTALAAGFLSPANLVGSRSVTVVNANTFTVQASAAATSGVTGDANISDKLQERKRLTLYVAPSLSPQVGDALIVDENIYKIKTVTRYDIQNYIVTFDNRYRAISSANVFLHSGYRTLLKFAPQHGGNIGLLKYFSEFQATFRNQDSCTLVTLNFGNDGFVSSTPVTWDSKVGTGKATTSFGGWGDRPWGNFPWGGETSINRELLTTPAIVLRTFVPKTAFVGTFLQPVFNHRVAGEPVELQSISLFTQSVTQRTTR